MKRKLAILAIVLLAGVLARVLTPDSFFSAIGEAWAESHANTETVAANDATSPPSGTPVPGMSPAPDVALAPVSAPATGLPPATSQTQPPPVASFTVPSSSGDLANGNDPKSSETTLQIFQLKNASAKPLAEILEQILGSKTFFFGVVADERTNSLLIDANKKFMADAKALIEQLDKPAPGMPVASGQAPSTTVSPYLQNGRLVEQGGGGVGGVAVGGRSRGLFARPAPSPRSTESEIREADAAVQAAAVKAKDVDEKWKEGSKLSNSADEQEKKNGIEQMNNADLVWREFKTAIARRMRAKYDSSGLDNTMGQELTRLYNKVIAAKQAGDQEDAIKIADRIATLLNDNESFQLNLAMSSQLVNLELGRDTDIQLAGSVASHLQDWVEASKAFAAAEPRLANPTTGIPKLAGATLGGARASAGGTSGEAGNSTVSIPDLEKQFREAEAAVKAVQKEVDSLSAQRKEVENSSASVDLKERQDNALVTTINHQLEKLKGATEERNRLQMLLVMSGRGGKSVDFSAKTADGNSDYVVRDVTTTLPNGTQTTRQEVVAAPRANEAELRQLIELAKQAAESSKAGKLEESAALLQKVTEALEQQRRAADDQRRAAEQQRREWELQQRRKEENGARQQAEGERAKDNADMDAYRNQIRNAAEGYLAALADPAGTDEEKKLRDYKLRAKRAEVKDKLAALTGLEFALQTQELDQMRERLDKLSHELEDRKQNRDKFIERELKEVLSPEVTDKVEPEKSDRKPQPRERRLVH